jgi:hypothetical protein
MRTGAISFGSNRYIAAISGVTSHTTRVQVPVPYRCVTTISHSFRRDYFQEQKIRIQSFQSVREAKEKRGTCAVRGRDEHTMEVGLCSAPQLSGPPSTASMFAHPTSRPCETLDSLEYMNSSGWLNSPEEACFERVTG